jgi:hypothetical protein
MMEGHPHKGDQYRQETARRDDSLDTARVRGYNETLTVPYGSFQHVLKINEFSPLEPGALDKDLYARGIGQLEEISVKGGEGVLELVSLRR